MGALLSLLCVFCALVHEVLLALKHENAILNNKIAPLVIVGLGGAGKTSVLQRLSHGVAVETVPTIGSNVETLTRGRLRIEAWDLGGQESLRSSWTAYFVNTDGLVLVVDSTDAATLPLVAQELAKLLVNQSLEDVPLLVFANKQDMECALTPAAISAQLHLDAIKSRPYFVQASSARTGAGVEDGLTWLAGCMKTH